MTISPSLLTNVDSYKVGMYQQLPTGTTGVYSYIESRGGMFDNTLFYGLQAFIKEYLLKPFTFAELQSASELYAIHGEPFNAQGFNDILQRYDGFFPVRISAVPEGSVVPTNNVLVTVENTDPDFPWATTWLETALLRAIWYPTTVATQGWFIKRNILNYLERTGDPSGIDFKLHDFGARGVSSFESAAIGGSAHLVNFSGTDTVSGILFSDKYYGGGVSGFSIPATEHSISTAYGKTGERDYVLSMINKFAKPGALFAMVADSYDVFKFCEMLGDDPEIRTKLIAHGKTGGYAVIRPDSGDPATVCSQILQILDEKFGSTLNSKGYRVLNTLRIIQGDGVNHDSINNILHTITDLGYSADNIAFGMGGALLQQLNRDTLRFAMKASAVKIDGSWKGIAKTPITDVGKQSKAGRVILIKDYNGSYRSGVEDWEQSALVPVYENGKLLQDWSFSEVRDRARAALMLSYRL